MGCYAIGKFKCLQHTQNLDSLLLQFANIQKDQVYLAYPKIELSNTLIYSQKLNKKCHSNSSVIRYLFALNQYFSWKTAEQTVQSGFVEYFFRITQLGFPESSYIYLALVTPLKTVKREGNITFCNQQLQDTILISIESIISQHIIIKTSQYYKLLSVLK